MNLTKNDGNELRCSGRVTTIFTKPVQRFILTLVIVLMRAKFYVISLLSGLRHCQQNRNGSILVTYIRPILL